MAPKNKIEVLIGGKVYTLVGQESQEYMQKVALYISKKMDQVSKTESSRKLSTNMIAILTSINVADDLFKTVEMYQALQEEVQKQNNLLGQKEKEVDQYQIELGKMQEENIQLREKLEEVQLELMKCKMELDEYISTFDHIKERKNS